MSELNLGKSGRIGKFDLDKIKSGIKKEDVAKDEKLQALFDMLDTDNNGTLSRKEIEKLKTIFNNVNTDKDKSTLSEKEAKNIIDKNGNTIGKENGKLFLQLLNNIMNKAEQGVKNVTLNNNNDDEVVTYEDGKIETIHKDGSKTIDFEEDGVQVTQEVDKDGNVTKETEIDGEGKTTVTLYDEKGNTKQQKITTKDGKECNIEYKDNKCSKAVITDKNANTVKYYHFDKEGNIIVDKVINTGTGTTTVYESNKRTVTQNTDNKTTEEVYEGETLISKKITEKNENGSVKVTNTEYSEGNEQTTITLDGKKQQVIKNGYTVNYDKDGYITGVIVQNGEGIRTIAKKFGCSVEDLLKANKSYVKGKSPNYYFLVGQEIRIPDMDVDSFIEINSTRKSAAETTQDYNNYVEQKRTEEEARLQAEKAAEDAKKVEEAKQQREANKIKARDLAQQFYDIADNNSGNNSVNKMSTFISGNLNKNNIVDFLDAYNDSDIRKNDSSIIDTIVSKWGADDKLNMNVLEQLLNTLIEAANEAGVDKYTITTLKNNFLISMRAEYKKIGKVNCTKMENALNSLLGQIKAAKANVEDVSEENAIQSVAGSYEEQVDEAQRTDNEREDNWIGKAADTVLGWFGCTTIEEMDEKLGACAADAKRLVDLAHKVQNGEDGAVTAFKNAYYSIFGVDFNPKVIAARDEMESNIALVQISQLMQEKLGNVANATSIDEVLKIAENLGLKEQLGEYLNLENATLQDYKDIMQDLANTYKGIADTLLAENGSLDNMQTSLEQLDQAAYGTQNPLKDAIKFNQNQQTTQMIAEITGEIALTIAISVATAGLGTAAAAGKLAATATKWGVKGAKMLKRVKKLESVLAKVNNAQKIGKFANAATKGQKVANRAIRAGVAAAEAAAATAIADTSYGKDFQETLKRSLSMAVFAGAGVVAADLAPILANAFKIGGKYATEVIEDFLNMAVATGVTYIENGTITDKDAMINALMIFAMGRLGHVKGEKPAGREAQAQVHNTGKAQPVRVSKGVKGEVNNHRDAIADGEVARNIDQSHVSETERRMVADALEDVPTPQEVEKFAKSLKEAPTPEEKAAIIKNNRKAAEAYAKSHQIGENLSDDVIAKLTGQSADTPVTTPKNVNPEIKALENDIKGLEGNIKKLEQQIEGAKKMGRNTANLEETLRINKEKLAGKQAELDAKKAPSETPKTEESTPVEEPANTREAAEPATVEEQVNVSGKHIEKISDIADMRNKTFNTLDETIEFFEYNGFNVERIPGTTKRYWGDAIEYKCTSKDGTTSYQFAVKPDGTTQITGIGKILATPAKEPKAEEHAELKKIQNNAFEHIEAEQAVFKEIDTYTPDNVTLRVTSTGIKDPYGGKTSLRQKAADYRDIIKQATEEWSHGDNSYFEYDIVKIPGETNAYIIYRPGDNMTSIVFETAGGRVGDNYTISIEGCVPETKCKSYIKDQEKHPSLYFNAEDFCKFMNE